MNSIFLKLFAVALASFHIACSPIETFPLTKAQCDVVDKRIAQLEIASRFHRLLVKDADEALLFGAHMEGRQAYLDDVARAESHVIELHASSRIFGFHRETTNAHDQAFYDVNARGPFIALNVDTPGGLEAIMSGTYLHEGAHEDVSGHAESLEASPLDPESEVFLETVESERDFPYLTNPFSNAPDEVYDRIHLDELFCEQIDSTVAMFGVQTTEEILWDTLGAKDQATWALEMGNDVAPELAYLSWFDISEAEWRQSLAEEGDLYASHHDLFLDCLDAFEQAYGLQLRST